MDIIEYGRRSELLYPIRECLLRLLYGMPLELVADCKVTIRAGWRNQPAHLPAPIYVEQLRDEDRAPHPGRGGNKAFVVMGRRSGKDDLANLVASYEAVIPRYRGWADTTIDPIYVVHPSRDLAEAAAKKFAVMHGRLSLSLPTHSGGEDWTGRMLLDRRGRPVVNHTTPNAVEFKALKDRGANGMVIWNDLAKFRDPEEAFETVASEMRQIAFTTGDANGFIKKQAEGGALIYQIPTWEARPDMTNAAFADIWKSSVERHPPHSEERAEATRQFNIEWGALYE